MNRDVRIKIHKWSTTPRTSWSRTVPPLLGASLAEESIHPAADYMHRFGNPGTVTVIGRATEPPTGGHLNTFRLRLPQDQHRWSM